jgi:hypothetical protein
MEFKFAYLGVSFGFAVVLGVIFGIIGGVITNSFSVALIAFLIPILASMVCLLSFIPFCGVVLFYYIYDWVIRFVLTLTGFTSSLGIFAGFTTIIFVIIGALLTALTTILTIAGLALLAKEL